MHICQTFRLWSQIWQLLVTLYKKWSCLATSGHIWQYLVTPGNIWSHLATIQLPTFRYILQLLPLEHLPYCHSRLSSLIISFPPLGIFLNTKWCRFLQPVSHHMRVCFQIRIVFPLQTLMCNYLSLFTQHGGIELARAELELARARISGSSWANWNL